MVKNSKLSNATNNTKYNPFNITNNAELTALATSGDGISGNPYIIENLIINNCTGQTGIFIQNTNKYFILRNITVSGCYTGITL